MLKPFAIFLLYLSLSCITFWGCQNDSDTKQQPTPDSSISSSDTASVILFDSEKEKKEVLAINRQVLELFNSKSYSQLPALVHPTKGVRFSQIGFVDTANDQGFSAERLTTYTTVKQNQKLVWGTNMEGDSIRLTVPEYFAKKVYRKDFLNADSVGYNIIYRTGSSPESMAIVYGHAPFVSNYFAGNEKKYGGLDWLSLRLVFEKYDDQYYLVGVINDEWTP